jgi:hypothetical protein
MWDFSQPLQHITEVTAGSPVPAAGIAQMEHERQLTSQLTLYRTRIPCGADGAHTNVARSAGALKAASVLGLTETVWVSVNWENMGCLVVSSDLRTSA